MKRRTDDFGLVALIVLVVLALVFLIIPILMSITMSFDGRSFLGQFPPPKYSLHWYEKCVPKLTYLR